MYIHYPAYLNFRKRCDIPYSECKATNHVAECVCKKDFKGNGTVECIPEGFTKEENGNWYQDLAATTITIIIVIIIIVLCD